jgi:hypothetical protein
MAVVIAAGLILPTAALAQTGATIAGIVRDSSGAVLPGVSVEGANPELIENVRVGTTDGNGQYRIIDLRPGMYSVTLLGVQLDFCLVCCASSYGFIVPRFSGSAVRLDCPRQQLGEQPQEVNP